jgi:hypothetical protein
MSPDQDTAALRKEAADKLAEAERLEALHKAYPNLKKKVGRWNKVVYYTKDVNAQVERFDMRHNCGCCSDSPLEIWPYLETPNGNVYSDPPDFWVGERAYYGDVPEPGWDDKMRAAGIPDVIIGAVSVHFEKSANDAREAVDEVYGNG